MTMNRAPQSGAKTAVQITGAMTVGGAVAILILEVLGVAYDYQATGQVGVALGVVCNAGIARLAGRF